MLRLRQQRELHPGDPSHNVRRLRLILRLNSKQPVVLFHPLPREPILKHRKPIKLVRLREPHRHRILAFVDDKAPLIGEVAFPRGRDAFGVVGGGDRGDQRAWFYERSYLEVG